MNDAWRVMRDAWKVDYPTREANPNRFEQYCRFFYVPFYLTNEMKETRPLNGFKT